jgi:hypothetical protein
MAGINAEKVLPDPGIPNTITPLKGFPILSNLGKFLKESVVDCGDNFSIVGAIQEAIFNNQREKETKKIT